MIFKSFSFFFLNSKLFLFLIIKPALAEAGAEASFPLNLTLAGLWDICAEAWG